MKNKITILIVLMTMSLFAATVSHAAFPIKKNAAQPASAQQSAPSQTPEATTVAATTDKVTTLKEVTKPEMHHEAAIPEILYIILAILPFGWLGIGINDNFMGYSWLIALILYFIFWLPGLIYTLVQIPKYY